MMYNSYGTLERYKNEMDTLSRKIYDDFTTFCKEKDLTPEEITICSHYLISTMTCAEAENRLLKANQES